MPEDSQKTEVSISDKEEMLYLNPKKEPLQREVTISKESRNRNGKRTIDTKLTGKKAIKLNKKRAKLQETPDGTSQKETSQNLIFIEISYMGHFSMVKKYSCWNNIPVQIPPQTDRKSLKDSH
jgi:hypothetical protein